MGNTNINSQKDLLLIGGGGHCRSVIDVIELEGKYNIIGITDKKERIGHKVLQYDIIRCDDDLDVLYKKCQNALITIGQIESPELRIKLYNKIKNIGYMVDQLCLAQGID